MRWSGSATACDTFLNQKRQMIGLLTALYQHRHYRLHPEPDRPAAVPDKAGGAQHLRVSRLGIRQRDPRYYHHYYARRLKRGSGSYGVHS